MVESEQTHVNIADIRVTAGYYTSPVVCLDTKGPTALAVYLVAG